MEKWYVAHSKPRNEEFLWKQFCLRHIESYFPCVKVKTVGLRIPKVRPYFPGYLFVHVDLELTGKSSIEWIPGGVGLVSFGDEPAPVSEGMISAIKQRVSNFEMEMKKSPIPFQKGDNVVINEGVFKGYEGIFDVRLSGADRVRVLLSLLGNRQVSVELSAGSLLHPAN